MPILIAVHIIGSLLVGFAGRNRRMGFGGSLLASLLFTPLLVLILLIATAEINTHNEVRT